MGRLYVRWPYTIRTYVLHTHPPQALQLGSEEDEDSERFDALCESAGLDYVVTYCPMEHASVHSTYTKSCVKDTRTLPLMCAVFMCSPKAVWCGQTEPVLQRQQKLLPPPHPQPASQAGLQSKRQVCSRPKQKKIEWEMHTCWSNTGYGAIFRRIVISLCGIV